MPKIVTVFRSRVRDEALDEYAPLAVRMIQICAVQRENEFRR